MFEENIQRALLVTNGFQGILKEADAIESESPALSRLTISKTFLSHEAYQVRSMGLFLLGSIAAIEPQGLELIYLQIISDNNWRIQEIAAMAFDRYCRETGYETALPEIEKWLSDPNPNICRAVTEGLRIWTGRPYFDKHPDVAIRLISRHKDSDSEYLRKSVGNSLRDIGKKFPLLIERETSTWDVSDRRVAFTLKYVNKNKSKNQ
jgi:hypothetical protein